MNNHNRSCVVDVCLLESPVQLTHDELLCCNSKMDMCQLKFDHTAYVVAVAVMFTQLIVGEDQHVIEALRSMGHNQLVESLVVTELELGI